MGDNGCVRLRLGSAGRRGLLVRACYCAVTTTAELHGPQSALLRRGAWAWAFSNAGTGAALEDRLGSARAGKHP